MNKGFNKDGFMAFLEQTFSGFENSFLRETVRSLVDYALEHCHHSLDQACYFLSDMLPEVEFAEVAMFMDDSMLTCHGREVKRETLEAAALEKQRCGLPSLEELFSAASCVQEAEISAVMEKLPPTQLLDGKYVESVVEI